MYFKFGYNYLRQDIKYYKENYNALHLHLADAFIQSDLQAIHLFYQYVCSLGIEPTTFCAAYAMLYH